MRNRLATAALLAALAWLLTSAADGTKTAKERETCGTIAGIACDDGLWCDPEPGFCAGADLAGICVMPSPVCTRDYRPVCGCDGKTYGNDCMRRAAREQKDHDGECEKKP